MVAVQVADEDLVEVVVGDLQRGDPLGRAAARVEQELVAVAQLDEEARGRLFHARRRHAGAAGDDAHLVGGEVLGIREIDIPRPGLRGRQLRRLLGLRGGNPIHPGCQRQTCRDTQSGNESWRLASDPHSLLRGFR